MEDHAFDQALITAAFAIIAETGWSGLGVAEAARRADLPLERARERFPTRGVVLLRFGLLADQAALAHAPKDGPPRDRLFDILMRRIDSLQQHRPGVLSLLRDVPADPGAALLLTSANLRSMAWMLEGAGIPAAGWRGALRVQGLLGVWLWTIRAWRQDESEDLSATMAALDTALSRAGQIDQWFGQE